jgi:hypothetical protein
MKVHLVGQYFYALKKEAHYITAYATDISAKIRQDIFVGEVLDFLTEHKVKAEKILPIYNKVKSRWEFRIYTREMPPLFDGLDKKKEISV